MDDEYDVIVLGTGFKECVLSGLLSVGKKKVLHMDRNPYYGGESASLTLQQLFEQEEKTSEVDEGVYGPSRDWSIDLVPKFIMASGKLVDMLIKTDVTKYLEFKKVDGSYVYKGGKVHKVPATDAEALSSSLLGVMEKRRCKSFFEFVQGYEEENPKTHGGFDLSTVTMSAVFKKYSLGSSAVDFIGHALALHRDDDYLEQPAVDTVKKIQLYMNSLARYGSSPYIYPQYGLGELPQAFARLAALYGGTYMLNTPIEEVVYEGGKAVGVKSEGKVARAKMVIGDPSYFPDKVKKVGQVVRCIALLDHPLDHTKKQPSLQVIIPQKQTGRQSDIYMSVLSHSHKVAAEGKFLVICSTTVETDKPEAELEPAVKLLGPTIKIFYSVRDVYEPLDDGKSDNTFITRSYDATSHFETSTHDILDVYRRITGEELDLTPPPETPQ